MTYNFESKARIEKEDNGALSFYDDRGMKIGSVSKGDSDSLARTYNGLRDAHEAGYLTPGKYEQFERIFRKRLGYEPTAPARAAIEARDRAHDRLVAKLMQQTPVPMNPFVIEVKPWKRAA